MAHQPQVAPLSARAHPWYVVSIMRPTLASAAVFAVVLACASASAQPASVPVAPSWPPLQLEMRVPCEPSAFPSAGRTHMTYELHLRNFAARPLTLQRIEVLDADAVATAPLASFD